jgi:hypothetical protein
MFRRSLLATLFGLVTLPSTMLFSATPPAVVNYQGVLRDATDKPLNGTHDMLFRFLDAPTGGTEIMIDQHAAVTSNAITVSNGLFVTALGGGTITDGSGAGTYTSLADVFRDYTTIYLEVKVGAETLSPRTQIISAAYALNATNAVNANSAGNASNLAGQPASFYLDTSSLPQTKTASVTFDSRIVDTNAMQALAASGVAVYASSTSGPGVYAASSNGTGVTASSFSAEGVKGTSTNGYGVRGISTGYVGVFGESTNAAGVVGTSGWAGGQFSQSDTFARAYLAYAKLGIYARGSFSEGGEAAQFLDSNYSAKVDVAVGDTGLVANGTFQAAKFTQGAASGAYALMAYNSTGVSGYSQAAGENPGWFQDLFAGSYTAVGRAGYKVKGSGGVSFVQNHPLDSSRVIVYTAPEGDENAVYTRGSARLENGIARVALSETFQWVANPSLGLTAHLTPRGSAVPLAVESLNTKELVVRGPVDGPKNLVFDYLVYGLRIGFEDRPVVEPKEHESFLPNLSTDQSIYRQHPELRTMTALARHSRIATAINPLARTPDLTAAHELETRIGRFDPQNHLALLDPPDTNRFVVDVKPALSRNANGPTALVRAEASPVLAPVTAEPSTDARLATRGEIVSSAPTAATVDRVQTRFAVSEPVEAGDLLAIDPLQPDKVRRAAGASDPFVMGIAAEASAPGATGDEVPVVDSSYALVKVDASFGAVRAGDLLVASPTPGHAMTAKAAATGTVIGKALGALDVGTGLVRVLVMPR